MKQLFLLIAFILFFGGVQAQNLDYLNLKEYTSYFDLAYGKHERNKFDILLPKADASHGLVLFIHGGGFKKGDKKALYKRKEDIKYFLDNNIAVATINYQFYSNNDSLGVNVCLRDIQRAIQFLRFNAAKFNIDKERVGCYGISAGAGSSLYFAFHDELAIQGDRTLLGESTRIKCAGAIATQATYAVLKWKKIVPYMRMLVPLKHKQFYEAAANFYGYPVYKSFKKQIAHDSEKLDMLAMIDKHDPPIYLMNLMKENFPKNNNVLQHHRRHAIAVSKALNKADVENYLYTSKNVETVESIDLSISEFMVDNLKK